MLGEEDLNPLGFHAIPPGRRVPSMMAPTVVLRDGEIELGLGSAGSNRIRSAILQTIVRAVEQGMGADEAVRAPRLHFEQGVVQAEPGIDEAALARIEARGIPVARRPADQPLLRRRAGRRPRSARPARSAAAATRAAAVAVRSRSADGDDRLRGRGPARGRRGRGPRGAAGAARALAAEGVTLEELREAVAAGRLTLLPVERALAGDGPRYTPREVAEIAGLDLDLLQRFSAALGVPYTDPDERSLTDAGPRGGAADEGLPRRRPARRRDAAGRRGRSGWGWRGSPRPTARSIVRTLMQPGDTERDLAQRFAGAAEHMLPLVGPDPRSTRCRRTCSSRSAAT